jgi:hypothetical protein
MPEEPLPPVAVTSQHSGAHGEQYPILLRRETYVPPGS